MSTLASNGNPQITQIEIQPNLAVSV